MLTRYGCRFNMSFYARAQSASSQNSNERLQSHTLRSVKRTSAPVTGQATALDEITTAQPALEPVAVSPANDNVCQSGLNGLTAGGVEGLDTVRQFACSMVAPFPGRKPTLWRRPFCTNLICCSEFCMLKYAKHMCRAVSMWQHSSQSCILYRSP